MDKKKLRQADNVELMDLYTHLYDMITERLNIEEIKNLYELLEIDRELSLREEQHDKI